MTLVGFQQEDACLIVNGSLLDAFLDVPCQKRRRFRLRFTGRTEINASSIIDFLNVRAVPFY